MPAKTPAVFHAHVAALYDIDAQIEALKLQHAALAKDLIAVGAGTYRDAQERTAIVVVPTEWSNKYDLYRPAALKAFLDEQKVKKATPALAKEFRTAQESRAAELAGEHWRTLFERTVIFTPTKGFADLVPKLLTTADGKPSARARDLLLHTIISKPPADAHVKLPDKPKAPDAGDADEE